MKKLNTLSKPLVIYGFTVAIIVLLGLCLVKVKQLNSQIDNLNSQLKGNVTKSKNLRTQLTASQQGLADETGKYNNLEQAVFSDPAHDADLNQLWSLLRSGKLAVTVNTGHDCVITNLPSLSDVPAWGTQPTSKELQQDKDLDNCIRLVDQDYLTQYIDSYSQQ